MHTQTMVLGLALLTLAIGAPVQADILLTHGYGNNFAYGSRYYDDTYFDRKIDRIERNYDRILRRSNRNLGDCLAQTSFLSTALQSEALARQAMAGEAANARIAFSVTEDEKGVEVLPKSEFDALQDKYERLMGAYVNLQRAYRDATGDSAPTANLSP